MGKTRKKKSENLFDKIVDQGFSLLLAFFFSTALVGGSGYLLFEFPKELLALDNQIVELDVKAQSLNTFNEMLDIVMNGWFSHPDEYGHEKEIFSVLSNDMNASKLDATFKSESVDWLTSAMSQLSKERGQVAGLNIIGEEERNLQESLLRQYDLNIVSLQDLSNMIFRWEVETFTEKDSRLATMQDSSLKSLSNLSMLTTQLMQIKSKLDTEKQKEEHRYKELKTQINIIYLKMSLSGSGIIIGVAVIVIVLRKLMDKQRQVIHKSKAKRS